MFKDKGGINIKDVESFNKALLYKWLWQFINEDNALWVKIIKEMGNVGKMCYIIQSRYDGGEMCVLCVIVEHLGDGFGAE